MEEKGRKVLFIDNFDSFTYNLVDDFCKRDCQARVYRADTDLEELKKMADEFIMILKENINQSHKSGVLVPAAANSPTENFAHFDPIL